MKLLALNSSNRSSRESSNEKAAKEEVSKLFAQGARKISRQQYFSRLSSLCTILSGAHNWQNFVSLIWSKLSDSYFVTADYGPFLFCTGRFWPLLILYRQISYFFMKRVQLIKKFKPELYKGLPSWEKCLSIGFTSPISLNPTEKCWTFAIHGWCITNKVYFFGQTQYWHSGLVNFPVKPRYCHSVPVNIVIESLGFIS